MKTDRPQWVMEGKSYDGTLPANNVNRIDAMKAAIDFQKPYERCRDVTDFTSDALSYHLTCARHAYAALAVHADAGKVIPFDGWAARSIENETPGLSTFILEKPETSGAYLISIQCERVMTDTAASVYGRINEAIKAELKEIGVDWRQAVMRSFFKDDSELTPSERLLKTFEKDLQNYRKVDFGDIFKSLHIVAINKKGPPPGIEAEDCSLPTEIANGNPTKGYLRGRQADSQPGMRLSKDGFLIESGPSQNGGSCDVVMPIISGLLSTNGFEAMIEKETKVQGEMSWKCFDEGVSSLLKDAAHRSVFESRGLFGAGVQQDIIDLSRGIAAHDISLHVEDYVALGNGMISRNIDNADDSFDANDGRDDGYAMRKDDVLSLFTETQYGKYRLDIGLDGDGCATTMEAFSVHRMGKPAIGRFYLHDGKWHEDYDGDVVYGDNIEHSLRNIKDMNNVIGSFASLACVFSEEMSKDDTPEP